MKHLRLIADEKIRDLIYDYLYVQITQKDYPVATLQFGDICQEPDIAIKTAKFFVDFLITHDVDLSRIRYVETYQCLIPQVASSIGHAMVQVDGVLIDFAARVYGAEYDFPRITTMDESKSEWGDVYVYEVDPKKRIMKAVSYKDLQAIMGYLSIGYHHIDPLCIPQLSDPTS